MELSTLESMASAFGLRKRFLEVSRRIRRDH
jgi:hypothetical protein